MVQISKALLLLALAVLTFPLGWAADGPPADLAGVWQGQLSPDKNTKLAIQFTFTRAPGGGYSAVVNSPDNPALKNVPASNVSYEGGALKLQVPALSGSFAGNLKDGRITGQWTQPGATLPLELAPYQAPALSKAAMDVLKGAWNGKLTAPGGAEVTLVTTFKSGDKGELIATLKQIEGGGQEIPLTDVVFADNKLSFRVTRANATYNGTLANGVFTGVFKMTAAGAPPDGSPLTLKRGDVAGPTHPLKLSVSEFASLSGTWKGKVGTLNVVFRFETNRDGQYVGYLDSPDQGAKGIPITEVTFAGPGMMKAQVGPLGTLEGTVAGSTLTGTWTQRGMATPITLTKSQ